MEPGPKRGGCRNTREGRDAGPEAIGRRCRPTGEYELDSGSCDGGAWCHPMWGSVSTLKTGVRGSRKQSRQARPELKARPAAASPDPGQRTGNARRRPPPGARALKLRGQEDGGGGALMPGGPCLAGWSHGYAPNATYSLGGGPHGSPGPRPARSAELSTLLLRATAALGD